MGSGSCSRGGYPSLRSSKFRLDCILQGHRIVRITIVAISHASRAAESSSFASIPGTRLGCFFLRQKGDQSLAESEQGKAEDIQGSGMSSISSAQDP